MLKNNKTYINKTKGSSNMPKGTMPNDMLARFKLGANLKEPFVGNSFRNEKAVKKHSRMLKTYRLYVHKCYENRLPSCLKRSVHYFCVPMSKSDSDNARDKRNVSLESSLHSENS